MKFLMYVSCACIFTMSLSGCKKNSQTVESTGVSESAGITAGDTIPWPFDQPPLATLRASGKKVFAHYFTQFPISIDNKDPKTDYYTRNYLNPAGEGGKHLAYGGYLRNRPMGRAPRAQSNWMDLDMEEEVRRAAAMGIDGFAIDLLSATGYHFDRAKMILNAAARVDAGFKVLLMPDMGSFKDVTSADLKSLITTLGAYSAALKLPDGRLVVAPYNAQNKDISFWKTWLADMKAGGVNVAFFPVFQAWDKYAASFAPISYGLSDWGWRSVTKQASWLGVPAKAQSYGVKWMMPVAPQDMRPKEFRYFEALGSAEFRVMWENAIKGGSDWVQLITWNDYSEHACIAPSTATQYAFYDLSAYYTTWFKTGTPPTIKRDVLYYFHRIHSTTAPPALQSRLFESDKTGSDAPENIIELVAFLQRAGTLEIEAGGKKYQQAVGAGLNSFKIPLVAGKPVFRLIRNNSTIITLTSAFEIKDSIDYQNMLYYGGSNTRAPVPTY